VKEYEPTLEDKYEKVIEVDDEEVSLDIFDTAGGDPNYPIMEKDGFMCIYSVDNEESFKAVMGFYYKILRRRDDYSPESRIPFVLVGNKIDLKEQRQVTFERGEKTAKEIRASFLETSARTGTNVEQAFNQLIREVKRSRLEAEERQIRQLKANKDKSRCILQ